ncbi:fimbrial protein [Erwinia mallotivora]|uniref:fimbrial protein n=1 Tax=Erwinia mallotivora TaxID=69222 RepID=UPI0035EF608B
MNILNFKKIVTITLIAGFSSSVASANDGTISFTGNISDATCIISGGDDTQLNQGADFTVTLPTVSITALNAANKYAGDTKFYINLSGNNCTDNKIANVIFERAQSTNIDSTTGFLKNTVATSGGGAANVYIRILNKDASALNLSLQNTSHQPVTIKNNTASFQYWAQYASVGGAASAGKVASDLVYSVTYQ